MKNKLFLFLLFITFSAKAQIQVNQVTGLSSTAITYTNIAAGTIISVEDGIEFKCLATGQGFQLQRPSGTRVISVHGSTLYATGTVFNSANENWNCPIAWSTPFVWSGQSQYDVTEITIYNQTTLKTTFIHFQHGLGQNGNNIKVQTF